MSRNRFFLRVKQIQLQLLQESWRISMISFDPIANSKMNNTRSMFDHCRSIKVIFQFLQIDFFFLNFSLAPNSFV